HVLPILREGATLPALGLDAVEPAIRRHGHGDTLARRRVGARPHVHFHSGPVVVGVLLARERADMPVALLVGVVDDPRLFRLAEACHPLAFSDRHGATFCVGNRWECVAICRNMVCSSIGRPPVKFGEAGVPYPRPTRFSAWRPGFCGGAQRARYCLVRLVLGRSPTCSAITSATSLGVGLSA